MLLNEYVGINVAPPIVKSRTRSKPRPDGLQITAMTLADVLLNFNQNPVLGYIKLDAV